MTKQELEQLRATKRMEALEKYGYTNLDSVGYARMVADAELIRIYGPDIIRQLEAEG